MKTISEGRWFCRFAVVVALGVSASFSAFGWVVGVSDACRRPQLPDVGYFMDALERAGHVPVTLQYTTNLAHIAEAVGRIDCLPLPVAVACGAAVALVFAAYTLRRKKANEASNPGIP